MTSRYVLKRDFLEAEEFMTPVLDNDPLLLIVDKLMYGIQRKDVPKNNNDDGQINLDHKIMLNLDLKSNFVENPKEKLNYTTAKDDKVFQTETHLSKTGNGNDEINDNWYFDSYSQLDIHQTMLKDYVRTGTYISAINSIISKFKEDTSQNLVNDPKHLPGKCILDLGCGTGILSMAAARASQQKNMNNIVIGIENANIIDIASKLIKQNHLDDYILLVKGRVEDIIKKDSLPINRGEVDIFISEWMGYCLLFESMLSSVILTRDYYLKRDMLEFYMNLIQKRENENLWELF